VLRVLGPLVVTGTDGPVNVGGPVPRRILTALLTRPGETLPADWLVLAAWGDEAPASAERTLQSHLTRLRDALQQVDGGVGLERGDGGFRLLVRQGRIRFASAGQKVSEATSDAPAANPTASDIVLDWVVATCAKVDRFETLYDCAGRG